MNLILFIFMEKFIFYVSDEESELPVKKLIKAKYHFSSRLMTKIKYQDLKIVELGQNFMEITMFL